MSSMAQHIKEAALRGTQMYLKLCTVDSVNENERTIECTPVDDTAQLLDVSLQSVTEQNVGLLIVPAKDSHVTVGFLDKNNAVVLLYSEIEKVILKTSDTVEVEVGGDTKINCDGKIEINGGKNDGLVKIQALKDNLDSLKDFVKNLATNIYTWGSALDAIAGGVVATNQTAWNLQAEAFTFKDMENKKIKH